VASYNDSGVKEYQSDWERGHHGLSAQSLLKFQPKIVVVIIINKSGTQEHEGRAIAQAVSRWLPTAAARVQNPV
jgi:hypothetical protein